jgi:hypothetical protein
VIFLKPKPPAAALPGNGLPLDFGWVPLAEAEQRFFRVERKAAAVP